MPRRPRSDLPEVGAYHVASRGTNHGDIYLDDIDRKSFMTILGRVVATHEWKCHAFCLMTTHYHLIVETERSKLSRGMQVLNGRYAQLFNQRHDRDGHLFRARYAVYVIEDEVGLEASCLYVLENPVRAGLCEKPSDWVGAGALRSGGPKGLSPERGLSLKTVALPVTVLGTAPFGDCPLKRWRSA
jgi:putative transposase